MTGWITVKGFAVSSSSRRQCVSSFSISERQSPFSVAKTSPCSNIPLKAIKGGGRSNKNTSFSKGSTASKKNKAPKSNGKHFDRSTDFQSREAPFAKPKSSSSSHTPPWSVRSPKDALKHVEEEKMRRANIQQALATTAGAEEDALSPLTMNAPLGSIASPMKSVESTPLLSKAFLSSQQKKFLRWKRFRPSDRIESQRRIGTFFNQTALAQQLPKNLGVPEVAFIGRSNVGKSSLLNRLSTGRINPTQGNSADVARVGKTPGATASVNVYALSDRQKKDLIIFTDLPGFGFAKLSKERQEAIIRTTEQYISHRATQTQTLALGIVLIDIRRTPSEDDRNLIQTLFDMDVPVLIVVTKMDKVSSATQREQSIRTIQEELDLPQLPLCVSSVSGENCNTLWQIILDACETCVLQMKKRYDDVPELYDDADEDDEEEQQFNAWFENSGFIDADDLEYDQGYDWNNDEVAMEHDDDDFFEDDNKEFNEDSTTVTSSSLNDVAQPTPTRVTLRSLRKRVKIMQKRGEI
jgi:GTP-binding protein